MNTDDPQDPILEAQIDAEIERALGPGKATLPPEILDELRMLLRIGLLHHPGARGLLDHLRPSLTVEKSDKVATGRFKNRKRSKTGNGGTR